jgi:LPS sulfotransferase NodH
VRPAFIVGCGRSGTTALGELLGRHPAVSYLHEPRDIWQFDPCTDVWSTRAGERGGRLVLGAADAHQAIGSRIARAFAAEMRLQGATRLVEKLPINSFRIGYVAALFADAQFIHVVRHGLEVARSIAKLAPQGAWFGHDDYKWRLLADLAQERGEGGLVDVCTTDELRGLLEWRLSILEARGSLQRLPGERWIEIRYENLVAEPLAVCEHLETFLGLPRDEAMRRFASVRLGRRSAAADLGPISPQAREIAGNLLADLDYLDAPRHASHG